MCSVAANPAAGSLESTQENVEQNSANACQHEESEDADEDSQQGLSELSDEDANVDIKGPKVFKTDGKKTRKVHKENSNFQEADQQALCQILCPFNCSLFGQYTV